MSFTSGQILTAAQLNTFDPSTKITNATGSNSAPSYTFNGDTDTGMFRSAADTVAFATGGTQVVTISSDGRLGVGDTSPSATLHVNAAAANTTAVFESTDAEAYIGLKDNSTGSDLHVAVAAISNDLVLRAGNSNAVRVKDDGDVGIGTTSPSVRLHVDAGTTNNVALFESTDSTTYVSVKDNSTSGNNHVAIGAVGDEMRLRANNTNLVKLVDPSLQMTATDGTLIAASPPTGTGNDAEWVTAFALKVLSENTSVAASKENITTDLGTHLTAEMIDSVVPKMWNRTTAPSIPEIGPIAEDMDAISPFLAAHGTDAEGEQILTGINKTGYLSLLVLAVKDLRTRVAALESA